MASDSGWAGRPTRHERPTPCHQSMYDTMSPVDVMVSAPRVTADRPTAVVVVDLKAAPVEHVDPTPVTVDARVNVRIPASTERTTVRFGLGVAAPFLGESRVRHAESCAGGDAGECNTPDDP